MPWCDPCDRYLSPNSLDAVGNCPSCGEKADHGSGEVRTADVARIPWHFWVLVVALVLYLGWRLLQGLVWVAGSF